MTAGSAGLAPTVDSACTKEAFRSRHYAEIGVRDHHELAGHCRQCSRGLSMQAYHCLDGGHWHVGHGQRRRSAKP